MNGYTLRELEAEFLTLTERGFQSVETLAEARGVWFVCPKCFKAKGGRAGSHKVICWFVGVALAPDRVGPGRWNPSGTSLDDLSFIGPGSYSVQLTGGCAWHGHISNGRATILPR